MSGKSTIQNLKLDVPLILPSLLLCDFGNLEREIHQLEDAGIRALHLDVMDGVFVPNMTYGLSIVEACRRVTELPLDVHLMIANPGRHIQNFYDAGADMITFHVEATDDPAEVVGQIRETGAAAGVALNPGTSISSVESCLDQCDLVLVMSVEAGYGGQAFQAQVLEKFEEVRRVAGDDVLLEIDGGVNDKTIRQCTSAGAELLVVGSAIFRSGDYARAIDDLQQTLTVN